MKEKTLIITPPALLQWLPQEDRSNGVVFLDLEPDFIDEKTIRLDLNIVFRPIPIRRGRIRTRDFYVGSTGARVVFEAFRGQVKQYTPAAILDVNHENSYKRFRSNAVKLSPEVEAGDAKVNVGEITFTKDTESTFVTRFTASERVLSLAFFGNAVEWELVLPKRQALRDYLFGNLFLYVESSWDAETKEGMIEVRPSDILFFDSERRVISDVMNSVAMRWTLYKRGIKVKRDSIIVKFKAR
jgi:hypothetical protein